MSLHWIDIGVLVLTLALIIIYGIYKSSKTLNTDSYLRGNDDVKWWNIGLSVMATQASAITFMSTPGQAFHDGMGFVQFYFGLPIAMIIICAFFIPTFHSLKVYTAYEYLEQRFDRNTRTLTSLLFLLQRGLGAGITIYAPSIILSTILGWNLTLLNILMGGLVVLYTLSGGTKAVAVTQKQQMFVMLGGMVIAFIVTIILLPQNVGFNEAIHIAGANGKLNILDFSFDTENRYTFWSGITGGMFLALAYFGTDQSQVQRYITGNSVKESRLGLVFNGLLKVPMQFFILLCGIMVFVFYQYNKAPVFFNENTLQQAKKQEIYKDQISNLELKYDKVFDARAALLRDVDNNNALSIIKLNHEEKAIRTEVKSVIAKALPNAETNDKDYVFISFVLKHLPIGIIGILLAVIFCAAMSSSSSEINALATCTTIDIYKNLYRKELSDDHYIRIGKFFTLIWGIIIITFANMCSLFENLIQFVNILGSLFYGTILGIFVTGFATKNIKGKSVFIAAVVSEIIILIIYKLDLVSYLWLNLIGCVLVITFSKIIRLAKDSN